MIHAPENTSVESPKRTLIRTRATFLKKVRAFFDARNSLEVDVPILSQGAAIDAHIDPFSLDRPKRYLHTSPEYAMKRLLAHGSGDIYFVGHAFRREEDGPLHNSEFTMVEWYKTGSTETLFLQEVLDLIALFLGPMPHEILSYQEAVERYSNKHDLTTPPNWDAWDTETKRHYIWGLAIEPHLGQDKITIINNFSKEDASLAATYISPSGEELAYRYEFYYRGIELANGFYELQDAGEQRQRFEEANQKRQAAGKEVLPLDEFFLADLQALQLPASTFGMALGFDRLLMLAERRNQLQDILLFPWHTI